MSPWKYWFDAALAANAASVTIGLRLLRLQQAMLAGDMSGGPEARRMVLEKVAAAQQGYWAGASALARAMTAQGADYWNVSARVAAAALAPSYRKARANARRLARRR